MIAQWQKGFQTEISILNTGCGSTETMRISFFTKHALIHIYLEIYWKWEQTIARSLGMSMNQGVAEKKTYCEEAAGMW